MIIITLQFTGNTALTLAAEKGFTDIVDMLLKQPNININAQNNKGKYSFISYSFFYTQKHTNIRTSIH